MGERHRPSAPCVVIVSGSVGRGHDAAALELDRQLTDVGCHVRRVDYLQFLPPHIAFVLRNGYVAAANRAPWFLRWLYFAVNDTPWVRRIADHLCLLGKADTAEATQQADIVVSTYPLATYTLGELKRRHKFPTPVIGYITDPAPHHYWLHPSIDHHLAALECTATFAHERFGIGVEVTGPLVSPLFSNETDTRDRIATRRRLGVGSSELMVLITAGSLGLGDIADAINAAVQICARPVVLGGSNVRLVVRAKQLGAVALGWRSDVPDLMAAADVLVQNAGGVTATEAMVSGLRTISYRPIAGHGETNAEVLSNAGLVPYPRRQEDLRLELQRGAIPRECLFTADSLTATARNVLDSIKREPGKSLNGNSLPSDLAEASG